MHITIRKSSDHNERRTIWLPMVEEDLEEICEELGIEMTREPNCYIEDARDERFLKTLADANVNIDELNYLMKRFDGFDSREIDKFYAVAFAEEYSSMKDLINLSFNLHGYSLVNNFDDFNKLGKDLYLTEKMAVASDELEKLDGEVYALDLIKNNKTARVTPYGVLYKNSNKIDQVYNGKQFPPYGWRESMVTLELRAKDQSEFIYLPSPDIEIEKALMRLGVSYLQDCELHLDSHNLPDKVLGMIPHSDSIVERLDILNRVSDIFLEMDGDIEYFEELMDYIKPANIDEVLLLAETMYEFETFDGIKNAEDYGRYMITESGRFEYDHNLEEYIDFKRYGEEKIANETGAFTDKGYILYHGYNQKLANLLSKNLGIDIPRSKEQKILKLYMPLTVSTYEIEIEIGTVPEETWNEEIPPEEKKKSHVLMVQIEERENPPDMEDIIAPNPPEYGGSIFGENGEINLTYTGESRTLIIPAGTDIRNRLGKKETLDSIKKGTVLMVKPKVIDGKEAGIEVVRILG